MTDAGAKAPNLIYDSALIAFLDSFESGQRGTGRTDQIIAAAEDGDLIVCAHQRHGFEIERSLRELGKLRVRVCSAGDDGGRFLQNTIHRYKPSNIYFDSHFLYHTFRHAIADSAERLRFLHRLAAPEEPIRSHVKMEFKP